MRFSAKQLCAHTVEVILNNRKYFWIEIPRIIGCASPLGPSDQQASSQSGPSLPMALSRPFLQFLLTQMFRPEKSSHWPKPRTNLESLIGLGQTENMSITLAISWVASVDVSEVHRDINQSHKWLKCWDDALATVYFIQLYIMFSRFTTLKNFTSGRVEAAENFHRSSYSKVKLHGHKLFSCERKVLQKKKLYIINYN